MNIQNETLLNPTPGDPNGFVSKDMEWAAIPCGDKFIIVYKGQQVHTANNYKTAKSYIDKQVKVSRKKVCNKSGAISMTQTFKCTSDAPYDRHNYEVVLKNGKKVFFDNWEDTQGIGS